MLYQDQLHKSFLNASFLNPALFLSISLTLCLGLNLSHPSPALAHDGHEHPHEHGQADETEQAHEHEGESAETTSSESLDPETHLEAAHEHTDEAHDCDAEPQHAMHPEAHEDTHHSHHHHGEENFSKAFAEGTPSLFSASTLDPDTFTLLYAHNFFWSSLPRSANPAFWFKYSPLQNLQADFMATLRNPLELEVGLAYQILDEDRGDWLNLTPRIAYNSRGNLVGAEVTASKYIFPEIWQVGLDARVLSTGAPDGFDRPVVAMGLNTLVRVWKHWHLFGDVVIPFDSEILPTRSVLWSAGIKKRIPDTPHILTLFVGNTQEQSLSGRTISPSNILSDNFRLGFVFSIQIPEISQLPARLF